MRQSNDSILVDGDMASDLVSEPIPAGQLWGITVSCYWTGSPVGVLRLQLSNFPDQSLLGANIPESSWVNYADTEVDVNVIINDQKDFAWIDPTGPHRWLRLKWEATSGSGILNANFNAKAP